MSEDLPAPLVPPEADLRGLEWMPVFGDRLFGSATWIGASAEGKVAALRLWWRAFAHEVPAGSLPDDDVLLADYAGYGIAVKAWRKVRAQALRGWQICSDGRLYHKFVAERVIEAWESRLERQADRDADRERLKRWREAKRKRRETANETPDETRFTSPHETRFDTPDETRTKRLREDRTGEDRTGKEPVEEARKRATRLPSDFVVPHEWRGDARKSRERNHLPPVDLNLEAEKFTNFWLSKPGQQGAKLDWRKTWINWALNATGASDGKHFQRANGTVGSADWWDVPKPPAPQSPPPVPPSERD